MSGLNGQDLPQKWSRSKIGDVISFNYGKGLTEEMRQPGTVPVYGSNGRVGEHSEALIPGPAIIVGRKGSVGAVHFEQGSCWPIDTTYFVNDFFELHPQFVYYQLGYLRLGQFDKSTAIPGISRTDVYAKDFVLCPVAEQERVADALDELFSDLDAAVAALERVRTKLAQYRASVLKAAVEGTLTAEWRQQHPHTEPASELLKLILAERRRRWETDQLRKFKEKGKEPPENWEAKYKEPVAPDTTNLPSLPETWCWARSEQLCDFITKGTTPPGSESPQSTGEVPFIKVQHLSGTGAFYFSESPSFVSKSTHESFLLRSKVFPNDVLMNIVGPPLVQVSVVPGTFPEWNINQAIAIFRPIAGFSTRLMAMWLLSRPVITQALKRTKTTAGQVNLTLEVCRDLPIPIPPSPEQEAIVEIVEDQLSVIEHLEADLEAKLKSAQSLRQAILHHAFTGQLVPQDPNDEPASELLQRIAAERAERTRAAAGKPAARRKKDKAEK